MAGLEAILEITQILALALIGAGTVVLGALVAPILFRQLSKIEAGIAMTEIFEKFSQWLEISALALFTSKLIEMIFIRKFNFTKDFFFVNQTQISSNFDAKYFISILLITAIFALSLYLSLELMPKLMNAFEDNEKEFNELHKKSEKLMKLNSILAILALIL
jgi:hypothetical protein